METTKKEQGVIEYIKERISEYVGSFEVVTRTWKNNTTYEILTTHNKRNIKQSFTLEHIKRVVLDAILKFYDVVINPLQAETTALLTRHKVTVQVTLSQWQQPQHKPMVSIGGGSDVL